MNSNSIYQSNLLSNNRTDDSIPILSHNKELPNECIRLSLTFLLTFLSIGLIGSFFCYYIYGIKFLIIYQEENKICNSIIWEYVLISIIYDTIFSITIFLLTWTLSIKTSANFLNIKLLANLLIITLSLVKIGIGIWGLIACSNEECSDIKDTYLFDYANVISHIQIFIGLLIITCTLINLIFCKLIFKNII